MQILCNKLGPRVCSSISEVQIHCSVGQNQEIGNPIVVEGPKDRGSKVEGPRGSLQPGNKPQPNHRTIIKLNLDHCDRSRVLDRSRVNVQYENQGRKIIVVFRLTYLEQVMLHYQKYAIYHKSYGSAET